MSTYRFAPYLLMALACPAQAKADDMIAFVSNFESVNGSTDIYISTENGSDLRKIAPTPLSNDRYPRWSADGSRIFLMRPDGSDVVSLTGTPDMHETYPSWSPDARRMLFVAAGTTTPSSSTIYLLDVDTRESHMVIGQPDTGPVFNLVYLDPVFVPGAGDPTAVQSISWGEVKLTQMQQR